MSPIFVIGANGCGKTTMAHIIAEAGGWYHWQEPNVLLRTGHAYRPVDFANATDACPWVKRFWKRTVAAKMKEFGCSRVVIDSPFAGAYIPYLLSIYPDALFVLVVRKPNSAFRARLPTTNNTDWVYDLSRKETRRRIAGQLQQISLREFPAYLIRFISIRANRKMTGRQPWFGLRYPGWKVDHKKQASGLDIRLKQWIYINGVALDALAAIKQSSWCVVRAEELLVSPQKVLREVGRCCSLQIEDLLAVYHEVTARRNWLITEANKGHKDFDHATEADTPLQDILIRLGYSA